MPTFYEKAQRSNRLTLVALLSLILAVVCVPLRAEEEYEVFNSVIAGCLERGYANNCIGASAYACIELSPAGHSTVGRSHCIEAELEWWEGQMDEALAALILAEQKRDDQQVDPYGVRPSGQSLLLKLQSHWQAYRDSRCDFEKLEFYGGTGSQSAWTMCRLKVTARQAIYLRMRLTWHQ